MTTDTQAPIDRYVVLEYLAEGGMGAIYLGKKLGAGGFEKQVVLKQLLPEFTQQPEFIELFLREARLSATLDHANIIQTIDLVTAGDEHFIVMEYLNGADLRTLLTRAKRRHKLISPAAAVYIAGEILSALVYAHNKRGHDGQDLRLIHRDLSPSNILISGNGEVKLTDFGIAKAATHNSVFYRVKGKVGYMSPEQAYSEPLDARSDLYSLSVCLYEMIAGERLFISAGLTTSAEEMYSQPVPLLSKKVADVPAELDKVMLRALATNPDDRYQSAGELQEALLRCAHRHNLLMSAPELANHLHSVCGASDAWRHEDESAPGPAGTEIYDVHGPEGFEMQDLGGAHNDYDVVAIAGAVVSARDKRQRRAQTSLSHLIELKGIELTSLVPLADEHLEGAGPLPEFASFEKLLDEPQASSSQEFLEGSGRSDFTYHGVVVKPAQPTAERSGVDVAKVMSNAPKTWVMLVAILLVGVVIALTIGFTGPSFDVDLAAGAATSETVSAGD